MTKSNPQSASWKEARRSIASHYARNELSASGVVRVIDIATSLNIDRQLWASTSLNMLVLTKASTCHARDKAVRIFDEDAHVVFEIFLPDEQRFEMIAECNTEDTGAISESLCAATRQLIG